MAEATGFEPVKGCYTLNDLANRRFQPLSHASKSALITPVFTGSSAKLILAPERTLSSNDASQAPYLLGKLLDTV